MTVIRLTRMGRNKNHFTESL